MASGSTGPMLGRWCVGGSRRPASQRKSATTPCEAPASRPIWRTAARSTRQMAAHASTRTTQLYDRREGWVALDEVVKINIRG
jgi:hypothetical protein